ncbi:STAS domain-containing protein [Streptomyces sp. NPDC058623]|uniref:STAS domain-containing protein n=1 Tax=Streptomyces sp. NPDC058623 TaxID=3346563 RepID=UPI00365DD079
MVEVGRHARGVVFTLRGDLDFDSVVQLREAGDEELAGGPEAGPLVADCSALSFCDSSGIGELVRLHQQLASHGRAFRLARVPDRVVRLFALTGLDQLFPPYDDVTQALSAGPGRRDTRTGGHVRALPSRGPNT